MVDATALERVRATLPADRFQHLVELFDRTGNEYVETIEAAHATGDHEALRLAAHTLKSSAGLLGARTLSEHLRTLEAQTRGGTVPETELIERTRALFEVARNELHAAAR